jgi:hypothetical protein
MVASEFSPANLMMLRLLALRRVVRRRSGTVGPVRARVEAQAEEQNVAVWAETERRSWVWAGGVCLGGGS